MAERKPLFRCLGGLCTRQKWVSQVKEPNKLSMPSDISHDDTDASEVPVMQELPPSSIEVLPKTVIDTVIQPLSCASTRRGSDEKEPGDPTPLITEDVYDPLIMSFSPRVSRRSSESTAVKSLVGLEKMPTTTVAPDVSDTAETNHFWYGMTLFRGDSKKCVSNSDNKCDAYVSVLDEHLSTDISDNRSESNMEPCQSSLRYYELMSHRISDDWSSLNSRVYDALLQYFTGSGLPSNENITKEWANNVKILMDRKSARIVNAFKTAYEGQLDLVSSYMICQSVFTAQKGMRIDLILRARVLPSAVNLRNTLQYTYNYIPRSASTDLSGGGPTYVNKFLFDCLKRNSRRTVSFTRDVSSVHGDDLHVATAESVSQVCEGDSIEIPVVLMNALGNTDIESIKFLPLRRQAMNGDPSSSLDKLHREWYTVGPNSQYLQQLFPSDIDDYSLVQPEKLQPELTHQVTQVAGIDVITSRSMFLASRPGNLIIRGESVAYFCAIDADAYLRTFKYDGTFDRTRLAHVARKREASAVSPAISSPYKYVELDDALRLLKEEQERSPNNSRLFSDMMGNDAFA
ncbi:uncharacterized protein BXIN_1034 [Babesia sp. Xinjiang]|uniref:uncharacterized protein n=1 Tax=Babesia sp. Xinjiang TaxID=462227 RepID=UPI000A236EAF|nr:uncharacterized protein BXIN_1034 [Babesia sp. Xinjiang]ORM42008.1 hypothetical protein BXIN_1034 [Babesia sp. Xinjiang]